MMGQVEVTNKLKRGRKKNIKTEPITITIDETIPCTEGKTIIVEHTFIQEDSPKQEQQEAQQEQQEQQEQEPQEQQEAQEQEAQEQEQQEPQEQEEVPTSKAASKKRGRKPKGGKIIQQILPLNMNKETKSNIILHLKCSLKELQKQMEGYNASAFESFQFPNKSELSYEMLHYNEKPDFFESSSKAMQHPSNNSEQNEYVEDDCDDTDQSTNIKDIWKKLKILEHNLHVNNISDKKSACFWCTHDFDNPPIYIPKFHIKDSYHVYGCFCSPECATAFLMVENLDSSTKFERYHLLNHIYSKVYDYTKNIKPAPNPFYMLNKYYGNLTIQEYRSLLKNDRLFLIVDKPLTRILPELHEDNDDFIINNKVIPSNNFIIKKKLQKKTQSKTHIINEKFGMHMSSG